MATEANKPIVPSSNSEFDKVYKTPFHWIWTDFRIPKELKQLVETQKPKTSLELGCGVGNFSIYIANQDIQATAVDFSSVAIEKAKKRVATKENKPTFLVGDVTNLDNIRLQFDIVFHIGCFHCLDAKGEEKYVTEVTRLLNNGGKLLIWAMDKSASDIKLSPEYIKEIFGENFELVQAKSSRRRGFFIVASHWYWLVKK